MTFINEDQNLNFFWGGWVITFNMYVENINLLKAGPIFQIFNSLWDSFLSSKYDGKVTRDQQRKHQSHRVLRGTDYTTSHWHWHEDWIATRALMHQEAKSFSKISTNLFLKVVGGVKCEDSWALWLFSRLCQNLVVVTSKSQYKV